MSTRKVVLVVAAASILGLGALAGGLYAVGTFILLPAINAVVIRSVPSEFPTYPSAEYRTGSVATSDCTWIDVKWYSAHPVTKVRQFYDSRLGDTPWRIISEDSSGITFSGGRNVTLWGRVTISSSGAGSLISLSGHTTVDTFGNRSQVCDQLYPRGTPTPVAHRASP
jgi:hypothetical protein